MEKFKNKVAVVTGSSSGIGVGICRELVKYDVIVVGLARRSEKLKELADELNEGDKSAIRFHPLKCDVTVEKEVEKTFTWITAKIGPINILVNNAGVMGQALLCETTGNTISQVYDTNVKAPILCAKFAIRSMIENSINGHIINICSMLGHFLRNMEEYPNYAAVYTSSKHALRVISEALRRELLHEKLDIKVTNLSPGLVSSEMVDNNITLKGRIFTKEQILHPKDIADACIYTMSTPPNVLISELSIRPVRS